MNNNDAAIRINYSSKMFSAKAGRSVTTMKHEDFATAAEAKAFRDSLSGASLYTFVSIELI